MNLDHADRRRPVSVVVLLFAALLGALLVALTTGQHADAAPGGAAGGGQGHGHGQVAELSTPGRVALHDAMRKLWEDHVTWTRLAIVAFADGSAGFDASAARLLQNQVDIGDAIKPYYGEAAGGQLTTLLHSHITIAVELLQAAKGGGSAAFGDASARWYDNANQIADFLANANPRYWAAADLRASMKTHLDQTLAEASQELGGDYAASVASYDEIHDHILDMADVLSSGIIRQFPDRFRR
jgi:hypothetical protein